MSNDEYPRPLRGLLPYMLSNRLTFTLVTLSGILYSGLAIVSAALGAWLVGSAITGIPASELRTAMAWLAGLAVATAVAQWWQSDIAHDWAFRLQRVLRVRIFDGLERATPGRLLGKRTGDLSATATADVNTSELFFAHTAGDYLGAIITSVAALAVIAAIDPLTGLVTLVLMVLIAAVPLALGKLATAQGARQRAELGTLNAEAVDGIQGLRELVVFRQTGAYLTRLLERTRRFQRMQMSYARRSALEASASELLTSLGYLVILVVAARAVVAGAVDVRWLPVLIVLGVASLAPIATVSATARTLGDVRAAAARILTVVNYPPHVDEPAAPAPVAALEPRVRFDDVRFRYTPDGPEVLRGVSFTAEPGETVALVGRSGAGKSTCANLLLRFWDPTSGTIELGGRDLRTLPAAELRRLVTLVPQDVYLFNASVADNIRLGRPDATDEEVEQAARAAFAHEFIQALPDGYATPCGERGAQLSGGQRQRIAIARALLGNAPVVIMDEAVSNLDTESERAVQDATARVRHGHTTLLIAHRLSTIRSADRVLLLGDGEILDTGRHEELLERSTAYRDLLATQHHGVVAA
ncbi:thiol reductant ABC exporter subunit CydC [Pseudonocardia sp. DSM 110487]|uniref:thiol reductant ABC exporter subunit CydC n=1 Tax=Pseudonocardia sp. DSM 110487 TaxID=2865833 RepID=UPI001C695337|nr:thiol reductant ABC exporter subunit CydC [Pseudonocardia sp. DSM 110487]QYN33885.1 thiol reductant ABC exporter subunit CydC [Pseudonocardia sp. DSM 110487]